MPAVQRPYIEKLARWARREQERAAAPPPAAAPRPSAVLAERKEKPTANKRPRDVLDGVVGVPPQVVAADHAAAAAARAASLRAGTPAEETALAARATALAARAGVQQARSQLDALAALEAAISASIPEQLRPALLAALPLAAAAPPGAPLRMRVVEAQAALRKIHQIFNPLEERARSVGQAPGLQHGAAPSSRSKRGREGDATAAATPARAVARRIEQSAADQYSSARIVGGVIVSTTSTASAAIAEETLATQPGPSPPPHPQARRVDLRTSRTDAMPRSTPVSS